MSRTLTLVPAYGRDYPSKAAVIADWESDKDFLIADYSSPWNGKPANRTSCQKEKITSVNIRYAALRRVAVIKVSAKGAS